MLISFEKVAAEIEIESSVLTVWIERSWVMPVKQDDVYHFDDADLARARLIAELHRDLEVNDEAMPVVLRLLDQVYSLRKALSDLNEAIKALPEESRTQLRAELAKVTGKADEDETA